MKERNLGVEFYRCLLMLGIVAIHASGHAAFQQTWGTEFFDWCVCGFVFISGYFGIKFRPSKVLSLIGIGIWCSFAVWACSDAGWVSIVTGANGFWFLWAYILLMMFAPLVEAALDKLNARQTLCVVLPILMVAYVWMFLLAVPGVRDYIPQSRGVQGLSFISILPIYIMARFYQKFRVERFLTRRLAVVSFPICIGLFALGFWWYWWIPALVVTIITFKLFSQMKCPQTIGRIAAFLAPSMFSVYMLHFSVGGVQFMRSMELCLADSWGGVPTTLDVLMVTLITFVLCILADLPRRMLLYLLRGCISRMCSWIDGQYERLLAVC